MSAGVNLNNAMARIRAQLAQGTITQEEAIAEADELMYDYIRIVGLNTAMDRYKEIRGWDF